MKQRLIQTRIAPGLFVVEGGPGLKPYRLRVKGYVGVHAIQAPTRAIAVEMLAEQLKVPKTKITTAREAPAPTGPDSRLTSALARNAIRRGTAKPIEESKREEFEGFATTRGEP